MKFLGFSELNMRNLGSWKILNSRNLGTKKGNSRILGSKKPPNKQRHKNDIVDLLCVRRENLQKNIGQITGGDREKIHDLCFVKESASFHLV